MVDTPDDRVEFLRSLVSGYLCVGRRLSLRWRGLIKTGVAAHFS